MTTAVAEGIFNALEKEWIRRYICLGGATAASDAFDYIEFDYIEVFRLR